MNSTYTGTVRNGKIEFDIPEQLPEGSQVSIIIPQIVDEPLARRKANGWLIDYVGNMLMADKGQLIEGTDGLIWQFKVFITSLSHKPLGPIGHVLVDAQQAQILNDDHSINGMIACAQTITYTA